MPKKQQYLRVCFETIENDDSVDEPRSPHQQPQLTSGGIIKNCDRRGRRGSVVFSVVNSLAPSGKTQTDLHVMIDMIDDQQNSWESSGHQKNNSKLMGSFLNVIQ